MVLDLVLSLSHVPVARAYLILLPANILGFQNIVEPTPLNVGDHGRDLIYGPVLFHNGNKKEV